jgi:sterol desaturase/sphingolipid hydroxylase (fatty acid hydroxylase superfamily)
MIYGGAVVGSGRFWGTEIASFVVIGSILWAVSVRGAWLSSLRKLPAYLFPPKLYLERTAQITHWNYLFTFLFWGPLFAAVSVNLYALSDDVNAYLVRHIGPPTPWFETESSIAAAQTVVLILCLSLTAYLVHLAQHKIPVLWSLHRAHHTVEALTLPALVRTHPLEFIMNGIGISVGGGVSIGLAVYILGLGKLTPAALGVTLGLLAWRPIHGVFEHGHIPISFGPLNRIFSGPILHQIHHSAEPQHRDKNMGGMFPLSIWDWMFGTLYLPRKGETYRWGLNTHEIGANNPHMTLLAFYLEPLQHAWTVIKGRSAAREADVAAPPISG